MFSHTRLEDIARGQGIDKDKKRAWTKEFQKKERDKEIQLFSAPGSQKRKHTYVRKDKVDIKNTLRAETTGADVLKTNVYPIFEPQKRGSSRLRNLRQELNELQNWTPNGRKEEKAGHSSVSRWPTATEAP